MWFIVLECEYSSRFHKYIIKFIKQIAEMLNLKCLNIYDTVKCYLIDHNLKCVNRQSWHMVESSILSKMF